MFLPKHYLNKHLNLRREFPIFTWCLKQQTIHKLGNCPWFILSANMTQTNDMTKICCVLMFNCNLSVIHLREVLWWAEWIFDTAKTHFMHQTSLQIGYLFFFFIHLGFFKIFKDTYWGGWKKVGVRLVHSRHST